MASRRPDTLLVHALRLQSAGGEELDVVRREGRRSDIDEGVHVQGHLSKGADDSKAKLPGTLSPGGFPGNPPCGLSARTAAPY